MGIPGMGGLGSTCPLNPDLPETIPCDVCQKMHRFPAQCRNCKNKTCLACTAERSQYPQDTLCVTCHTQLSE